MTNALTAIAVGLFIFAFLLVLVLAAVSAIRGEDGIQLREPASFDDDGPPERFEAPSPEVEFEETAPLEAVEHLEASDPDWEEIERDLRIKLEIVQDLGDSAEATETFETWAMLGQIYRLHLNRPGDALDAFERALDQRPEHEEIRGIVEEMTTTDDESGEDIHW